MFPGHMSAIICAYVIHFIRNERNMYAIEIMEEMNIPKGVIFVRMIGTAINFYK